MPFFSNVSSKHPRRSRVALQATRDAHTVCAYAANVQQKAKVLMKVVWCSRHALSDAQLADLRNDPFITAEMAVECRNITWAASQDAAADAARNRAEWALLYSAAGRGGVVAGVFPPVALEARKRGKRAGIRIASPVSRQAPELRVGDGPIPFAHVRWAWL